ncbi:MAG: outer membrane protein assembly factor BamB family protein [Cellulomonadaceae bacterium]
MLRSQAEAILTMVDVHPSVLAQVAEEFPDLAGRVAERLGVGTPSAPEIPVPPPDGSRGEPAPSARSHSRWRAIAVGLVGAVALGVAGVALLASSDSPAPDGWVRSYDHAPRESWVLAAADLNEGWSRFFTVAQAWSTVPRGPLAAGDSWVLGYLGSGERHGLVGLDPQTGAVRWYSELEAGESVVGCAGSVDVAQLSCVVAVAVSTDGWVRETVVYEIDAGSGRTVETGRFDGELASFPTPGGGVVLLDQTSVGSWTLHRPGPDGWSLMPDDPRAMPSEQAPDDDAVWVNFSDGARAIDPSTGQVLQELPGAVAGLAGEQLVFDDGRYLVPAALPAPDDGHAPLVLLEWQLEGDGIRYAVVAQDATSGTELWMYEAEALRGLTPPLTLTTGRAVLVLDDRSVVGLEPSTGETLWQRQIPSRMGNVATDGERVMLSLGGTLTALDLRTGELVWEAADLSATPTTLAVDGTLVSWSSTRVARLDP